VHGAVRLGSSTKGDELGLGHALADVLHQRPARWAVAAPATRKARSGSTPTECSAIPKVTGPVSEILMGPRRSATVVRNARRPTKLSEANPGSVSGASGSRAASSMTSEPSSSTVTPATPWAAWPIIPRA